MIAAIRRRFPAVALALLTAMLTACSGSMPPGAQQVRVGASDTDVHLAPAVVHAGDVYIVPTDIPAQYGVALVLGISGPDESPGPLTDEQLAQLEHTDHVQGVFVDNVGSPQWIKYSLREGKYAVLLMGPGGRLSGPGAMAVLEVVP